jgi:hypothetical protein
MKKYKLNYPKPYAIMLFWLCLLFGKSITYANTNLPTYTNHKIAVNGLIIYLEISATPAIKGSYNFPGLSGNEEALQINSYSFDETKPVSATTSGQALEGGKPVPPTFEFLAESFDKAIVGLYGKLMARTKITEIKAQVYYFDGTVYKHIEEIRLLGVYIEKIDASAINGNSTGIVSNVGLKYEKIAKTIYAYNSAGVAVPMENTIMTWNYITQSISL